jgi:diguanylate cyclase (GGDEF)-like protein
LLLVFSRNTFDKLISDNPETATHFIRIILSKTIKRLRESSSFLADVVQWGESASRRVITDEMTGIYNRAFLDDAMDNFFHISKSNNKAVSLLMIDVDNFRKANNKLGLDIGDSIIIEISTLMQHVIEKDGIIARYGGDEFSILLPEATLEKAVLIAESIRKNIEESTFSQELGAMGIPITISVGVSSYPQCGDKLESFKEMADKNLYKAKKDGRNRVVS